jgi:hypothetical protein
MRMTAKGYELIRRRAARRRLRGAVSGLMEIGNTEQLTAAADAVSAILAPLMGDSPLGGAR